MGKYTVEENTLILISLLKEHKIRKIIASPGATNINFVNSVQNDDFFEVYSCVDERSAAYLACGLAEESGEPVVLSCTGATASRNYFSGLTEAFYRKLPIIAITSTQHTARIGQGIAQVIDRSTQPKDIVKISVQLPIISTPEDRWECNLNVNKALLEAVHNSHGPVHINLVTNYSNDFSVNELPKQRVIKRIEQDFELPEIINKEVAIFIGAHSKINEVLEKEIEKFCEKYNAVVLEDRTGNYFGKYKVLPNIICNQESSSSKLKNIELLIDIGNISGAYINIRPKEVWRVNPDGMIKDTYKKLTKVFEMSELSFFKRYNELKKECEEMTYAKEWELAFQNVSKKINDAELPFSNIWIARNTLNKLPDESTLHLAILNSLRSWNFVDTNKKIYGYSNTGGFGIDGILSTIVGASYYNREKNIYGVIGDLAFFYDMNSLGIRDIGNNIRLLLINNAGGTEFHNYNHRAAEIGNQDKNVIGKFVAADGHFGNKSDKLVKNYVENLGFKYLSASNKDEYLEKLNEFIVDKSSKSIVFEVFTNTEDESNALKMICNLEKDTKGTMKNIIKNVVGVDKIKKIKKLIKK